MLRVSTLTTNTDFELNAVNGDQASADGVPYGGDLVRFADAVAHRDADAVARARQALLAAAGSEVLVDAAGVAANFQRMVRIADAIGIPVDDIDSDMSRQIRADLQLERFATAHNTPGAVG